VLIVGNDLPLSPREPFLIVFSGKRGSKEQCLLVFLTLFVEVDLKINFKAERVAGVQKFEV